MTCQSEQSHNVVLSCLGLYSFSLTIEYVARSGRVDENEKCPFPPNCDVIRPSSDYFMPTSKCERIRPTSCGAAEDDSNGRFDFLANVEFLQWGRKILFTGRW